MMSDRRSAGLLKLLRLLTKLVSWGIILVSALAMPILLYQCYAVFWGGFATGEVFFLDARAPARWQAVMELTINLAILAGGIMLEHFGTRAVDRFSAGRQTKACNFARSTGY
jgi:hypothetical protein